jgi:hypothetical protein
MPSASRAHGERIWRVGVFAGPRRFAGRRFVRARRFAAGLRFAAGRRDGEVFVATYTSMMTGRITGFRWVTS